MNFAQVKGISIPQGSVKQLAQGQTVLWKKGAALPYDARVTYLQSDGSAFIDTGVNFRTIVDTKYDVAFGSVPSATSVLFGAWWEVAPNTPQVQLYLGNSKWSGVNTSQSLSTGITNGANATTAGKYNIKTSNKAAISSDTTAYLFARNHNAGTYLPTAGMRVLACTMASEGAFVRDMYPVRKGTVGYLYDAVSGLLLPNSAGSGAFTYGGDTPFTYSFLNSDMRTSMQGMAIYGDRMVRANNGTTFLIYSISSVGDLTLLRTLASPASSHNNSMQFAPTLEAGQTIPFLYSSGFEPNHCDVYEFSADYSSMTKVQTITLGVNGIVGGCNLQIGDDGHIWGACSNDNEHFTFMKFRKVLVSEGDITLTDADILDSWTATESFPYSTHIWQSTLFKRGRILFLYGMTGSGQSRGVAIYDSANHTYKGNWDLGYYNEEPEGLDFWSGGGLMVTNTSNKVYRLTYDTI
jgi:hypothetical protein